MRESLFLVVRAILGAVAGGLVGFLADFLTEAQGFWLVGALAGAIGSFLLLYWPLPFRRG